MSERKRNVKTCSEQLEIIINFIKENKNWLIHSKKSLEDENKWEGLVATLNDVRKGARKTPDEWKRFVITWKSKTKAKARLNKRELLQTGGGSTSNPNLTDLEEQLMALIGWNVIEGCQQVPQEIDPILYEPEHVNMIEVEAINAVNEKDTWNDENNVTEDCIVEQLENQLNNVEKNSEERKEPKTIKKSTALKRSVRKVINTKTSVERSAEIYLEGSRNLLKASEVIAASINAHAAALVKCAEVMEYNRERE